MARLQRSRRNRGRARAPNKAPEPRFSGNGDGLSLIGHLEELRGRIFKMLIAFVAAAVGAWFLYDRILAVLVAPLAGLDVAGELLSEGKLIFTSPPEAFFIRLKVVSFAGFVLALPVILWQVWRFVAPGLYSHEKKYAIPFVVSAMLLFLVGGWLAMRSLPQALEFLVAFAGEDIVLVPRASEYLSFVMVLVAGFGLTFEFPLVLIALSLVGVVSSESLRRGRKIAWIAILVVAAVVTPTQDPLTQLLLALPLAALYEATILAARLLKR